MEQSPTRKSVAWYSLSIKSVVASPISHLFLLFMIILHSCYVFIITQHFPEISLGSASKRARISHFNISKQLPNSGPVPVSMILLTGFVVPNTQSTRTKTWHTYCIIIPSVSFSAWDILALLTECLTSSIPNSTRYRWSVYF